MVSEAMSGLHPSFVGFVISMTGILGGITISLAAILSYQWRILREKQLDHDLKRDMIARGMSAAEIERVMGASRWGGGDDTDRGPREEDLAGYATGLADSPRPRKPDRVELDL